MADRRISQPPPQVKAAAKNISPFSIPPNGKPDLLEAALAYARYGKPVFPNFAVLKKSATLENPDYDKHPCTTNGFRNATKDSGQIEAWWHKRPDALIGMPMGSASGLFVIDLDVKHGENGFETLAALEAEFGPLPETLMAETWSGGRHLFFQFPSLDPTKYKPLGNSAKLLGPGIDTRGEGGYIIVPPSPIGGKYYRYINDAKPAILTEWAIEKLRKSIVEAQAAQAPPPPLSYMDIANGGTAYGLAALEEILREMANCPKGKSNETLNKLSFRLGQLVSSNDLTVSAAESIKYCSRLTARNTREEIEKTFNSGFQNGQQFPATRKPLEKRGPGRPPKSAGTPPIARLGDGNGQANPDHQTRQGEAPAGGPQSMPGSIPGPDAVYIVKGQLHKATRQAYRLFMREVAKGRAPGIYLRGGLIRICHAADLSPRRGLEHSPLTPAMTIIDRDWLRLKLTEHVLFFMWSNQKKDYTPIDAPQEIVASMMADIDDLQLPILREIRTCPALHTDGRAIIKSGYDAESQIFFAFDDQTFPAIPERPSRGEINAAINLYSDLLAEFPFVSPDDKAVFIASVLTVLLRHWFGEVPFFAFSSPVRGSGKTTLAVIAGIIATGFCPAILTWPDREEEVKKLIFSILLAGSQIALIDNLSGELGSNTLNATITAPFYEDRALGESRKIKVPTAITFFGTANNFRARADLSPRVSIGNLDPDMERPEERRFSRDVVEYATAKRPQLVAAALVLMKGFIQAGDGERFTDTPLARTKAEAVNLSGCRFGLWGRTIRAALIWATGGDPWGNASQLEGGDSDREAALEILETWRAAFGGEARTIKHALALSDGLMEAFRSIFGRRDVSPKSISAYIRAREGRWINGLRFERSPIAPGGVCLYKVVEMAHEAA